MTSYPAIDEVIAVHARLIARFGGSLGIRDRGGLESALASRKPVTTELETWLRRHTVEG